VPRAWYSRIDNYTGPTLYTKVNDHGQILIAFIYVDDMIFTSDFELDEFKATMMKEFEMTDLGLMKYFLGIEVE